MQNALMSRQRKSKLADDNLYTDIYIYICVCVCVCVYDMVSDIYTLPLHIN